MAGFEEHASNVLAKEIITDKEMEEFARGRPSKKIRDKMAQYDQTFAQDPVVIRRCKECGNLYSYPVHNAWARSKLGEDEGLCHICSGAYDDPDQFIKLG